MSLEVWGGAEITCNRVGDAYIDQMQCSGHASRLKDLEAFASLGLRTLRMGLLWERHEREPSWAWSDARLECMRALGLEPIAGLVHHGSGPPHTSLIEPQFPTKLAAYAKQVVERYPWINAYTPVNEPHTTARFSALYGVWYPHCMSRKQYLIALLHQTKGTVLSMEAIRRVRPDARLIQTEDVGRIWTTHELRSTGDLLHERRWLALDLLCGRVDAEHPLFGYMRQAGIGEREILWFLDHPCPPDVIGINYYLTSDRYLDHRVSLYPRHLGSAEGPFADVEAVRVLERGIAGFEAILVEAWQRYHLPVAITEVHLGSHVHEQIRWLAEAWEAAQRARRRGVDCRAITVWALLGSYYWNSLVTHQNGYYEPGAFDVSQGSPEATPLAEVVRQITRGAAPQHPALERQGWWRRPERILYEPNEEVGASLVTASAY